MSQSYIASVNPARRAKQLVVPTPQRTILPQPLLPDQPLTLSHPTSPISDSGSEFEPNAAPPPPPGPAKRGRKPGPLSRAARETQRKLNHSIIEKARRTKINDALASLRALVPSGYGVPKDPEVEEEQGDVAAGKKGKGKKDDKEKEFKLEILERTVVYLNDLIKRVEVLERNAGPSPGDATNTSICNKCSTSSNALKRKRAESTAISEYNRDSPRLPPISSWLLQSQSQADAQIDPQLLTSPSAAVPIGGLPSPPASTHFTPQHPPVLTASVPTLHLGASSLHSHHHSPQLASSLSSSSTLSSNTSKRPSPSLLPTSTPLLTASPRRSPEDESAASLLLQISAGPSPTLPAVGYQYEYSRKKAKTADVDARTMQAQTPGSMLGLARR